MAAVRIRGEWLLTLTTHEPGSEPPLKHVSDARLEVTSANRAGVSALFHLGSDQIPMQGRLKPGNPSIVTLQEFSAKGDAVEEGVEAIFYIPAWWPNVDYQYDVITGTMTSGRGSGLKKSLFPGKLIMVTGVQPFVPE